MKLTRDSMLLTLTIIAAAATIPFAAFDKIPWLTSGVQQTIMLIASAAGIIAGILKTSPLPVSREGYRQEVKDHNIAVIEARVEGKPAPLNIPLPPVDGAGETR